MHDRSASRHWHTVDHRAGQIVPHPTWLPCLIAFDRGPIHSTGLATRVRASQRWLVDQRASVAVKWWQRRHSFPFFHHHRLFCKQKSKRKQSTLRDSNVSIYAIFTLRNRNRRQQHTYTATSHHDKHSPFLACNKDDDDDIKVRLLATFVLVVCG